MAGMDDFDGSALLERQRANPGLGLTGNTPFLSKRHLDTSDAGMDVALRPQWMDALGVQGNIDPTTYSFLGYVPQSTGLFGKVGAPKQWLWNMGAGGQTLTQGAAEGGTYSYNTPTEFARFNDSDLARAALQGKWSGLNGTQYDVIDANTGKVIGQRTFEGLKDEDNMDLIVAGLVGAGLGGMALTAAGGAGAAGAAGGGVTGLGDAGAMYGGLDAASAASLGGGASVGGGAALGGSGALGAGAAGVSGLGDAGAMYAGLDSTAAGALGGGGNLGGIGGFSGATSAGGSGFMDLVKSGASKLLGGAGGGGVSWTDFIGPAMQLVGGAMTSNAAGDAADAMAGASREGIAENRRQFDTVRKLLSPYVNAGAGALGSYQALSGALGPKAQQAAITALQGTPQYGQLVKQGEDAILQNASATGGLRGGNVQNGLADYRTRVLSGLIDQQLGRYGGLATMGQNSAAGVGTAALNTGARNAELMQQQGAAQAGGIVAGTNAITNALGGFGGFMAARGAPATTTAAPVVPASNFGSGVVYPEYATTYGGGF